MGTVTEAPGRDVLRSVDQRVTLRGLSWADYERLLAIRGDDPAPRMTYLGGELELMMPSRNHEGIASCLGRLIEAYADERHLDLQGYGSWTLRSEPRERGLEPDKCYIVGDPENHAKDAPDLAIEVDWTRSSIDKLEVYQGLGVSEVWIWHERRIEVHVMSDGRYESRERSALFPDLDLGVLAEHAGDPNQARAVRAFRSWLRGPLRSR